MGTKSMLLSPFIMFSAIFDKIKSVFFRRDAMMSNDALELLNDPRTRNEFLEFSTGIDANGNRKPANSKVEKTFVTENGHSVTITKY